MKKAFAIIYRDIRSLQIKSLLLSYALAALFFGSVWLGLGGLHSASLLQAFPIAVRNEDDTLISKNIVYQISKMEIFSEVYHVKGESNEALIEEGYVGVLTIPKDFFYKVYTFDNEPIEIALASSNSIQAMFLQEIIVSAMDIITTNQAARLGEYTYLYGEDVDIQAVYEEASKDILGDLLQRHGIYASDGESYPPERILAYRLAALGIGILAMFFTCNAVRSMLKDENGGVYARMPVYPWERCLISIWHILYTYLLLLPIIVAVERGLMHNHYLYILSLCMIVIFYVGYVFLKIWLRDESLYNRISGLLLAVLIFTSGQIWNINIFGDFYQHIIRYNPIYRMNLSLLTENLSDMYKLLSGVGILYLFYLIKPKVFIRMREPLLYSCRCNIRWLQISMIKAYLMMGRWQGVLWTLAVAALLAAGFSDVRIPKKARITLAVVDYERTKESQALLTDLSEDMEIVWVDEKIADRYIMENKIEGKLVLTQEGEVILRTSPLSKTKEAIKELISSKILSYRIQKRIEEDIAIKRGSALSEAERGELRVVLSEVTRKIQKVYTIRYSDHEIKESYFMPDIFRFILYILFLNLLLGFYVIANDSSQGIEKRLSVLSGKGLAFWSDCCAMIFVAMSMGVLLLYFAEILNGTRLVEMCLFISAISVILKFLSKLSICQEGAEVFYPVVSLILAFALRCFIDIRL